MTYDHKFMMSILAELLSLGLIKEDTIGWRLTDKGKVEADKVFKKLSDRESALVMLRAGSIIKGG